MITFNEFVKLFSKSSDTDFCIEINFCLGNKKKYQNCWMGKTKSDNKETYWFGLTEDGSQAYDYDNFTDFSQASIFCGKSLKEMWSDIKLLSVDGCDPEERIQEYLK